MNYINTLIYLIDWVTWVSSLEGENVTHLALIYVCAYLPRTSDLY